jgi:hypothetical protein
LAMSFLADTWNSGSSRFPQCACYRVQEVAVHRARCVPVKALVPTSWRLMMVSRSIRGSYLELSLLVGCQATTSTPSLWHDLRATTAPRSKAINIESIHVRQVYWSTGFTLLSFGWRDVSVIVSWEHCQTAPYVPFRRYFKTFWIGLVLAVRTWHYE